MIIFRADGNKDVGAGHMMRCLSIAQAASGMGEECLFVTASADFRKTVEAAGYAVHVLHSDYRQMERENWGKLVQDRKPCAVFVDSYYASKDFLNGLWKLCQKKRAALVYVDDVLAYPYPCDYLVNYNIYADESAYQKLYEGQKSPVFLLGTEYVPLRTEFAGKMEREVKKEAERILVSTGGADTAHLTAELLRCAGEKTGFQFHFVIGALNPDKELLRREACRYGNVVLHENVTAMADLMRSCDAAISAAGSTLYELCATQTPTVTYVLADNQIPGAEGFAKRGIMKNCGDVRSMGKRLLAQGLVDAVSALAGDENERRRIAEKMRQVICGNGAERIVRDVIFHNTGK